MVSPHGEGKIDIRRAEAEALEFELVDYIRIVGYIFL
jgi:hypothetical protein